MKTKFMFLLLLMFFARTSLAQNSNQLLIKVKVPDEISKQGEQAVKDFVFQWAWNSGLAIDPDYLANIKGYYIRTHGPVLSSQVVLRLKVPIQYLVTMQLNAQLAIPKELQRLLWQMSVVVDPSYVVSMHDAEGTFTFRIKTAETSDEFYDKMRFILSGAGYESVSQSNGCSSLF